MSATALWTAVKASYETEGLVGLTNIRDPSGNTVVDAVGEDAAQAVIDLWPAFAQTEYDAADSLHVEVAKQGVIALLWRRGGSSTTIAEVKWDEVFGADGLLVKVLRTGARARVGPATNSTVVQSIPARGRAVRGWSDHKSYPPGTLPPETLARGDT